MAKLDLMRMACVAVAVVSASASADPLPNGTGTTHPFYTCFVTADCALHTACVDNGGDGQYYCKPICSQDTDCNHWPYPALKCLPVSDASGRTYDQRVCNDHQSTLATIVTSRQDYPTGTVGWYEVLARAPEAQALRIDLGLRSDAIKSEVRNRIAGPVQAAVASKFGTVNWVNFRFSNFRATIDSIAVGPGATGDTARIFVAGTINAAREQYVWRWQGIHSGMRWEGRGDKDVATYRAEILVRALVTRATTLPQQRIEFVTMPGNNAVTINLNPVRGMVMNNAFRIGTPPPTIFDLAAVAQQIPPTLKRALVRYVHFTSINDREMILEVDVN